MVATGQPSRRALLRAAAIHDIKEAAWAQIHDAGAERMSLRRIGDAVGMSPAGLYTYYDSRDELLTDLITDAFLDLAGTLEAARDAGGSRAPGDRLLAAALAYRTWALARPHAFALLYGSPVRGYNAPLEGPTTAASRQVNRAFLLVLEQAVAEGALTGTPAADSSAIGTGDAAARLGVELPGDVLLRAIGVWARLHGLVCLELFGHLHWTGADISDLFVAEVTADLVRLGVPPVAGDPAVENRSSQTLEGPP